MKIAVLGWGSLIWNKGNLRLTTNWTDGTLDSSWRGLQSDASTPDDSRLNTPETTPPSIPTNSATAPWISHRINPPLPQYINALIGNVILFLARMSFVFATSVFGFVFITQKSGFHIPAFQYIVTLGGLFSLYCYVQELERLGRTFAGREKRPEPTH